MKRKLIASLLPLFISVFAFAGNNNLRVEVEVSEGTDFNVIPVDSSGMILLYDKETNLKGKDTEYQIVMYNNEFKEKYRTTFVTDQRRAYEMSYISDGHVFVLLGRRAKNYEYSVVDIDLNRRTVTEQSGEVPVSLKVEDFKVLGDQAILSGNTLPDKSFKVKMMCLTYCTMGLPMCLQMFGVEFYHFKPIVCAIDMGKGTAKVAPLEQKGHAISQEITLDEANNQFQTVMLKNYKKKTTLELKTFDADLRQVKSIDIKAGTEDKTLQNARALESGKEDYIVGTYSKASKTRWGATSTGVVTGLASQGIYFSKFSSDKQKYIKYYPFTEFDSFWESVSDRFAKKIEKKKAKKAKKGKEYEVNVSYNLLMHEPIMMNGEIVVVSEAYYPEYHTETYWTTDANGNQVMRTRQVFDGWRFTHAIIAGFDDKGALQWDHSFRIMDILTMRLKEQVITQVLDDELITIYSHGGFLKSKVIQGSKVLAERDITQIENNSDGKVKGNWSSDISYWYGNYFISHGFQKIKLTAAEAKKKDVKRRQTTFYFNKIAYN